MIKPQRRTPWLSLAKLRVRVRVQVPQRAHCLLPREPRAAEVRETSAMRRILPTERDGFTSQSLRRRRGQASRPPRRWRVATHINNVNANVTPLSTLYALWHARMVGSVGLLGSFRDLSPTLMAYAVRNLDLLLLLGPTMQAASALFGIPTMLPLAQQ